MPYDQGVAARLRAAVMRARPQVLIDERKMFGGIALLLDGSIAWGVLKSDLGDPRARHRRRAWAALRHAPVRLHGSALARARVRGTARDLADEDDLDGWISALGIAGAQAAAKTKRPASRAGAAKARARAR